MKSFKQYLLEELSVEEIQVDAKEAADFLDKELKKIFKGKAISANVKSIVAKNSSMVVNYFNAPMKSSEVDKLNAGSLARFIMHLRDRGGRQVPMSKFTFESLQIFPTKFSDTDKFLTFRKISAKSPMDASKKLLIWFKKNKDILIGEVK